MWPRLGSYAWGCSTCAMVWLIFFFKLPLLTVPRLLRSAPAFEISATQSRCICPEIAPAIPPPLYCSAPGGPNPAATSDATPLVPTRAEYSLALGRLKSGSHRAADRHQPRH